MIYRNQKLTKLAKGKPCVCCGSQDGSTVWAHSNLLEHGKGKSIKASDAMGMLLCMRCHFDLDQGKVMSKLERRLFQIEMIVKTYRFLVESGCLRVADEK